MQRIVFKWTTISIPEPERHNSFRNILIATYIIKLVIEFDTISSNEFKLKGVFPQTDVNSTTPHNPYAAD